MSQNYPLTIKYQTGEMIATWDFNGQGDQPRCKIEKGDTITFTFDGPDQRVQSTLISGKLKNTCHHDSPFVEGNRIDILTTPTLTAREEDGLWGFTVSFSTQNPADGTTAFYYLPDPELQVGTIGDPSDDLA